MKLRLTLTALLALSLNGCMTQEMWEEDKKVEKITFHPITSDQVHSFGIVNKDNDQLEKGSIVMMGEKYWFVINAKDSKDLTPILNVKLDKKFQIADAKKYVSALIVPCFDSVEEYAKKLNIKYQDRIELLKHSEIIKMFEQRIESLQKELAHFEQVKKFTLLSQAFSVKLGEITPTLKLRRKVIMERYRHIIDSMYSNNKENKENKE